MAQPGGEKRKDAPDDEVVMEDPPTEAERHAAKRKAKEQTVGEAVKAMKLDEMIAFVNEASADMGSLHVAEPR